MDFETSSIQLRGQNTHGLLQSMRWAGNFLAVQLNMNHVRSVLSRDHPNQSKTNPEFFQSGNTFTLQLNSNTQKRSKAATLKLWRDHPSVFVPIHLASSRLSIAIPSHRREPNIDTFCRTTDCSCLWASIENDTGRISRYDTNNFLTAGPVSHEHFGTVSDWMLRNFRA